MDEGEIMANAALSDMDKLRGVFDLNKEALKNNTRTSIMPSLLFWTKQRFQTQVAILVGKMTISPPPEGSRTAVFLM